MRTSNPSLKSNTFSKHYGTGGGTPMTINGTVNKTIVLLLLVLATSLFSWDAFLSNPEKAMMLMIGGAIAAFIVAMITCFVPKISPVTAPLYALLEGLAIGAISAHYEAEFGGIVLQAALLTFGVLFSLLLIYKSGWIKVTENFKLGVFAATGAVFIVYLLSFIGSFVGFSVPFLHDSGPIGIGIGVVIIVIAALNLVLDFDYIESSARNQVPKYFEWYAAFGLLVTLVWLYLEILRLLAKLKNR